MIEPGGVSNATVFAFERACMAGDEQGAKVIIESVDPVALSFALAAWHNTVEIGRIGEEEWDARLAECIAEAARE